MRADNRRDHATGGRARHHHSQHRRGDRLHDVTQPPAKRYTDADFPPVLQHRVIEDTVQSDARQHERNGRKEQRQHREHSLANHLRLIDLRLRDCRAHSEAGSRVRYRLTERESRARLDSAPMVRTMNAPLLARGWHSHR